MHHYLMVQTVVVMLEDVEVRILNVGITQGDLLRGIVNFRVRLDLLSKSVKVLLKSEWIYEVVDFSNYQLKNLKDFCPKSF